jgi:hypothetical protein
MAAYNIVYTFCGYPKCMHMLYKNNKWIGTYETRAEAHKAMQADKAMSDWTLITA